MHLMKELEKIQEKSRKNRGKTRENQTKNLIQNISINMKTVFRISYNSTVYCKTTDQRNLVKKQHKNKTKEKEKKTNHKMEQLLRTNMTLS